MLDVRVSTVIFQMLNFFVLLGVLQYFLYRPLLKAMKQREEAIAARIQDAEERAKKAEAERAILAQEAEQARREAVQILDDARSQASLAAQQVLDNAQAEAARTAETARQRVEEAERATLRRLESRVTDSAVSMAGSIIRSVAGPTVHEALLDNLEQRSLAIPPDQRELLRQTADTSDAAVTVDLAYPPTAEIKARVDAAISGLLGADSTGHHVEYRVDPALVAGARILVGTVVVDLSLNHSLEELKSATLKPTPERDGALKKETS